jgi:hypothetical protein
MVRLLRALKMTDKIPVEYLTRKELHALLEKDGVNIKEMEKRTVEHMDSIRKTMEEPRESYCQRGVKDCTMIGCDCFKNRVNANKVQTTQSPTTEPTI